MSDFDCRRAFEYAKAEERTPEQEAFLREHLATCEVCRREEAAWTAIRRVVEAHPVPEGDPDLVLGLARSEAIRLRSERHGSLLRWFGAVGLVVLLAGGVLLLLHRGGRGGLLERPRYEFVPVERERVVLHQCPPLSMNGRSLRPGEGLSGGREPARILSGSSLRVVVAPGSRLERLASSDWSLALDRGAVYVEVSKGPWARCLSIRTPFGQARVLGTRFLVRVAEGKGSVVVYDGRVGVTGPRGQWVVPAGHTAVVSTAGARIREELPELPTWAGTGTLRGRGESGVSCRTDLVRKLATERGVRAGLARISECRQRGDASPKLLFAEAELLARAGRVRQAVGLLHRLARSQRGRSLGQDALFLAAQLEWTRLGARRAAARTFQRYLTWYPRGRYAADARRLLALLGVRPRSGGSRGEPR